VGFKIRHVSQRWECVKETYIKIGKCPSNTNIDRKVSETQTKCQSNTDNDKNVSELYRQCKKNVRVIQTMLEKCQSNTDNARRVRVNKQVSE